jgi:hypothetical protein
MHSLHSCRSLLLLLLLRQQDKRLLLLLVVVQLQLMGLHRLAVPPWT